MVKNTKQNKTTCCISSTCTSTVHLTLIRVFVEIGRQHQSSTNLTDSLYAKAHYFRLPTGNNTFLFINQRIETSTHCFHFSELCNLMQNNSPLIQSTNFDRTHYVLKHNIVRLSEILVYFEKIMAVNAAF